MKSQSLTVFIAMISRSFGLPEGWLYLAIVLDLFSRQIVGWSMSSKIKKELVINALRMAIFRRRPEPGLIFHSDSGSQYCSNDFSKDAERKWHTQQHES